jgi:hypothetical protein
MIATPDALFTTFRFVHNFQMGKINYSVCSQQAFKVGVGGNQPI